MFSPKKSFKQRLLALIKEHSSPAEIALGVAIGVLIAILPLYGLHTAMVIIAAILIKRANKLAIFLGTSVSTTLTFPFITWAAYAIGRLIFANRYPPLRWAVFEYFNWREILRLYPPLFAGSVVLGLFLAVFFYFLTLQVVRFWRRPGN